jgi:hypothetical protein
MKETQINTQKSRSVVDKVASGEQTSLSDESLTPPKKIAAEQQRMQHGGQQAAERKEEDRQRANLGSKEVLTPGRKVAQDSQDRQSQEQG